jgi:DUF1680 family protein
MRIGSGTRGNVSIGPFRPAAGVLAAAVLAVARIAAGQAALPAGPVAPAVPFAASPLPLGDVRLTGGPLKRAQDLDADYLLKLEPDRILARFRERAGLPAKAQGYGGWEGPGRNLNGHFAGHYLSGLALMYTATGDARFKDRADAFVAELKEIQDKQGDGYLGALTDRNNTDGKALFQQIAQGTLRGSVFDLNGMWSPWYVEHKLFAGLRDAYRLTGNRAALDVELKFAAWAESIVGNLSDAQTQKMLDTEFGGMNEVLVDLYADTGDRRWLSLADKFQHRAVVEPLAHHQDILAGKHGNTQVPKLLGHLERFLYTADRTDGDAASYFWDAVVDHHSFATGGHGYDEYFGPPDALSGQIDGTGQRSADRRTAETCNVYNMLKMTRRLFALRPEPKYADFHERALFNHILASINLDDGRTCYMVPVGNGVRHEYQDMFGSFTCCVGTGMESHALHADGLYYTAGDRLWVNLYAPSDVQWKAQNATLSAKTTFPEGDAATYTLTLPGPKDLTLSFRRPAWAGDGFALRVNGQLVPAGSEAFVDVSRRWSSGDTVTVSLPKALHAEPLPDNPQRTALLWGPLVLAADLGPEPTRGRGRAAGAGGAATRPAERAFLTAGKPLTDWLQPAPGAPGHFHATASDGADIPFVPFYQMGAKQYAIYWDVTTPEAWARKAPASAATQPR